MPDCRVACGTGDEFPRDHVGLPQSPEHLKADRVGRTGGAVGEIGQREQQRDHALQHVPVGLDLRRPVLHRTLPANRRPLSGRREGGE